MGGLPPVSRHWRSSRQWHRVYQSMADRALPPLLDVRDLKVYFPFVRGPLFNRIRGAVRAVDGVSFSVAAGETFGLVGESGCGKSTTARAILNLIRPTAGEVRLEGERIDGLSERQMLPFRRDLQMIFQ